MRILALFGFPFQLGGHFRSALAMMKCLLKNGIHFTVLIPSGGSVEMKEEFLEKDCCDIIPIPKISPFHLYNNWSIAHTTYREIKRLSIDVVHAWDFNSLAPGYWAATQSKTGFVVTRAGGPIARHGPPKKIDIVFFSEELCDGMKRKFNLSEKEIHLIRARIDMETYKCVEFGEDFISRYHLPMQGKRIVIAMRLAERKRAWLNSLMRLAIETKNDQSVPKFIVAGEGPLLNELKKQANHISRDEQESNIRFIGPIYSSEEMNQLYNYSSLVIGHGRGILEAMACGKPVVVLGENGCGEIVDGHNIDEVERYNFSGRHLRYKNITFQQSLQSIRQLLQNEEMLKNLGNFSKHFISKIMDAEIGAAHLHEIYKRARIKHLRWQDFLAWYLTTITKNASLSIKRRLVSLK